MRACMGSAFENSRVYDRLTLELNRCIEEANISEWGTKTNITLIKKDPQKEPLSATIDR